VLDILTTESRHLALSQLTTAVSVGKQLPISGNNPSLPESCKVKSVFYRNMSSPRNHVLFPVPKIRSVPLTSTTLGLETSPASALGPSAARDMQPLVEPKLLLFDCSIGTISLAERYPPMVPRSDQAVDVPAAAI
jgi:hypothetical protein